MLKLILIVLASIQCLEMVPPIFLRGIHQPGLGLQRVPVVFSAPRRERAVRDFIERYEQRLDLRDVMQRCGLFEVTFVDPQPLADFRRASCFAMEQIISPRLDYDGSRPIRVQAQFGQLDPGVLGGAGPPYLCTRPDNLFYPPSILRLDGDLDSSCGGPPPVDYEISMTFTTAQSVNWYLGLDGETPSGSFDFATVVAHEIMHGLGFLSAISLSDQGGQSAVYELVLFYVVDGLFNPPIDNSSTNNLLTWAQNAKDFTFSAFQGTANTYPNQPSYSTDPVEPGSSVSHFTQNIDVTGAPPACVEMDFRLCNSLMRPAISDGVSIHQVGGNTMALLNEIGYNMVDCPGFGSEQACLDAQCDWCSSANTCTLLTMVDDIWQNCPNASSLIVTELTPTTSSDAGSSSAAARFEVLF